MTAEAFMPLTFAPGEAYQFNWRNEVVLINGTTVKIKVDTGCAAPKGE